MALGVSEQLAGLGELCLAGAARVEPGAVNGVDGAVRALDGGDHGGRPGYEAVFAVERFGVKAQGFVAMSEMPREWR